MTVRDELITALTASSGSISLYATLAAGSTPFDQLEAGNVYIDGQTRARRANKEVLLIYLGRDRVWASTGRRFLTRFSIELFLASSDRVQSKDRRYEIAVEQAAQELVEALDQKEATFNSVLTAQVHRVSLFEASSVDILFPDEADSRTRYVQTLQLEVEAFE